MLALLAATLTLLTSTSAVRLAGINASGAPINPSQVMFGVWWDSTAEAGDRPATINAKLGYNCPIFSLAQDMPLPAYNYVTGAGGPPQVDRIVDTGTDAAVFLTVYPTSIAAVTTAELNTLAIQLQNYTVTLNRTVYLRFAPEMQGQWFQYGGLPSQFVPMWQLMYTTLKAAVPDLIVVWAPNLSLGWPNGHDYASYAPADAAILDTNRDGQLTAADDAYAPYYPGDQYVDAIGLSVYFKGPGFQNINQAQPAGFCTGILDGIDVYYGNQYTSFATYMNRNKPVFFAESGAAYHVNVPGGATEEALQQGWWRDCITNTSMYDRYPGLRGVIHFEHTKLEYDNNQAGDLRDYRLTNDTATLAGFKADLAPVANRFLWANAVAAPLDVPASEVAPSASTSSITLPRGSSLFSASKSTSSELRVSVLSFASALLLLLVR